MDNRKPEAIKEHLNWIAQNDYDTITQGHKGAITGLLEKLCKGKRKELLNYLYGKKSSKLLTEGEWYALSRWLRTDKIDDQWVIAEWVPGEIEAILNRPKEFRFD